MKTGRCISMVELLASGGTFEMVQACAEGGADAVYVGALGWSRRRREYEMDDETIKRSADFLHERGKKIRVAINTLPASDEVDLFRRKMEKFASFPIDDVILTDPGLMRIVKEEFPEIKVHASVGCTIVNLYDALLYKDAGASQVVTECRMPLDDIREIREKVGVGVEVLVHATTCYTFLGRCTMSSYTKFEHSPDETGKKHFRGSPNRGGLCYRICLTEWEVRQDGGEWEKSVVLPNTAYFIFDDIPALIEAGVTTLKIQGREYSPGLVGEMVSLYRRLIDECIERGKGVDIRPYREELERIQSRRDAERTEKTRSLIREATL
ncbi:MAG: U32 family peptidase [Deltaproteobacteria bacterium]|nr:MAG: U32 family peptidase [Deltaproteobacteria bacterium]